MRKLLLSIATAGALGAALAGSAADAQQQQQHYGYNDGYRNDYRGGYGLTLSCSSQGHRYNFCPSNVRIGRVEIDRRYSDSPCRYGRTWGYNDRGVWVDRGCRARFIIQAGGRGGWNGGRDWRDNDRRDRDWRDRDQRDRDWDRDRRDRDGRDHDGRGRRDG